jgi:hypothetical protein
MKNPALALASTLLILTFTHSAAAASASYNKELTFSPGGQTVGGPGFSEIDTGTADVIWNSEQVTGNVCVTVANIGDVLLSIQLSLGSIGGFGREIPAGRTKTLCTHFVVDARISCIGDQKTPRGATCEALWRVDEYHPVSGDR